MTVTFDPLSRVASWMAVGFQPLSIPEVTSQLSKFWNLEPVEQLNTLRSAYHYLSPVQGVDRRVLDGVERLAETLERELELPLSASITITNLEMTWIRHQERLCEPPDSSDVVVDRESMIRAAEEMDRITSRPPPPRPSSVPPSSQVKTHVENLHEWLDQLVALLTSEKPSSMDIGRHVDLIRHVFSDMRKDRSFWKKVGDHRDIHKNFDRLLHPGLRRAFPKKADEALTHDIAFQFYSGFLQYVLVSFAQSPGGVPVSEEEGKSLAQSLSKQLGVLPHSDKTALSQREIEALEEVKKIFKKLAGEALDPSSPLLRSFVSESLWGDLQRIPTIVQTILKHSRK